MVLLGEDEEAVKRAADEVNSQIRQLKKDSEEKPATLTNLLAALNIAEKYNENRQQSEISNKYIIDELKKMAEFLKNNISN